MFRKKKKEKLSTNPRNKESSSMIFERNEEKKRLRGNWRRKYIVRKNCVSTEQLKNRTFDGIKQLIFTCQSKIISSFYFLIYDNIFKKKKKKLFSEITKFLLSIITVDRDKFSYIFFVNNLSNLLINRWLIIIFNLNHNNRERKEIWIICNIYFYILYFSIKYIYFNRDLDLRKRVDQMEL